MIMHKKCFSAEARCRHILLQPPERRVQIQVRKAHECLPETYPGHDDANQITTRLNPCSCLFCDFVEALDAVQSPEVRERQIERGIDSLKTLERRNDKPGRYACLNAFLFCTFHHLRSEINAAYVVTLSGERNRVDAGTAVDIENGRAGRNKRTDGIVNLLPQTPRN